MRVPNKIWHFIWCIAKDALPMKQNLKARYIPIAEDCDGCGEHTESIIHCLWLCDRAKSIWFSNQSFYNPRTRNFRSFGDLVSFVLSELSSSIAALFSVVAWCIWTRRNRLRERQPVWDVGETVKKARELCRNLTTCKTFLHELSSLRLKRNGSHLVLGFSRST